jgi:DinB superfamily
VSKYALRRRDEQEEAPMQRDELMRRYEEGPNRLAAAVRDVSDAELDHRPADGGWSAREIVHHTADSELTSAIRVRKLLGEDDARIDGYDEMEFSRRLHYRERPIAGSLAAVRVARESSASILACLSDAEWERTGIHSESGPLLGHDVARDLRGALPRPCGSDRPRG